MKKLIILLVTIKLALLYTKIYSQDLPEVVYGSIERVENFKSEFVKPRNVDVWLPNNYSKDKKYPVIYMHDGQMLFDATKAWNKSAWEVDDTLGNLIKDGKIEECIVVGIWNIPEYRFADYFPEKIIKNIKEPYKTEILTKQIVKAPSADNYLKFITKELKPYIDKNYATLSDTQNTYMIGSSMGGLISIYALCEYPNIFGAVACMSIHTPIASYELIDDETDANVASKFREYLKKHLPKANTRKIYFDYGNQTGDKFYEPYQNKIDSIMTEKGYNNSFWQTQFFPGESHTETSWAKRLEIPVLFLLGIQ